MPARNVTIGLKRVYEPPCKEDGTRILVERLWPRGVSKEKAAIDLWLKDIAPSPPLRKWYSHDTSKWDEFRRLDPGVPQPPHEFVEPVIRVSDPVCQNPLAHPFRSSAENSCAGRASRAGGSHLLI
jgi:Protein of unknown function, DUF488